jgi:hypothetical protein
MVWKSSASAEWLRHTVDLRCGKSPRLPSATSHEPVVWRHYISQWFPPAANSHLVTRLVMPAQLQTQTFQLHFTRSHVSGGMGNKDEEEGPEPHGTD